MHDVLSNIVLAILLEYDISIANKITKTFAVH